ncbi:Regulatory protein BlaR1 [Pirellulimonas nuda]|uniref:Regulatory protein BlaR1 n=1 Tax=Pirellulimonas nuda TaxID=2528009 RepID=A0A518D8Y6_9BACT|nr:M56 family metallopeptidase [Pirellulimonas nuda]QDU87941.1 Regulatory protein BlaR1 [Pirellulimonas nuda]
MNLLSLFTPELCGRLCMTLVHSLWQVAALAALAWAVARVWRGLSVEWSYAVHAAALVLSCACVPVTFLLLDAARKPAAQDFTAGAVPPLGPMLAATDAQPPTLPADFMRAQPAVERIALGPGLANDDAVPIQAKAHRGANWAAVWKRTAPWFAGLYAAGVLVMLVRIAVGIGRAERLRARSRPVEDGALTAALRRLAQAWSLRAAPALATAQHIVAPKVVGLLKPTILLPASALSGLSPGDVEMILAHELAHIRRHDLWVNLVQRLAETVLFFNPALWLLSRRVSTLREYCCDELACGAVGRQTRQSQLRYAQALLHLVELSRTAANDQAGVAALAASGRSPSELRRRVARLFGEPVDEPLRLSRSGVWALLAIGAIALVGPGLWSRPAGAGENERTMLEATDLERPFMRPLATGGEVELIAIGDVNRSEPRWWSPDGRLLPDFKLHLTSQKVSREAWERTVGAFAVRAFVYRTKGVASGSSTLSVQRSHSLQEDSVSDDKNENASGYRAVVARINKQQEEAAFVFTVADQQIVLNNLPLNPTDPDAPAILSGKIVLEDGSPATVKGQMYSDVRYTNGNGALSAQGQCVDRFSVELGAGTAYLTYYAPGYAPVWTEQITLAPGELRDDITLTLKPGADQRVRVVNEQGAPIAGATLIAYPRIHDRSGGPIYEQQSDEQGEYTYEQLAATKYVFSVKAAGYEPLHSEPLDLLPDQAIDLTLKAAAKTTGVVVRQADLAPLASAKICLKCEWSPNGSYRGYGISWGNLAATTDDTGRFTLDQLTRGSHYLAVVEAADGARAMVHTIEADENQQIVMPPRRDLVVTVTGDLSKLRKTQGKITLGIRQRATMVTPDGQGPRELFYDSVVLQPTATGGEATFRGLAVNLDPAAEKQQVEVTLDGELGVGQVVDMNREGDTLVDFKLPSAKPAATPATKQSHRLQVIPARLLTNTNDISTAKALTPERLVEWSPAAGQTQWLLLADEPPLFTERDVESAEVTKDKNNPSRGFNIAITLSEAAGGQMRQATARLLEGGPDVDQRLATIVASNVVTAPCLMSPIGRQIILTGVRDAADAERLSEALNGVVQGPETGASGAAEPAEEPSPAPQNDGVIEGQVVDPQGQPVAGAEVGLVSNRGKEPSDPPTFLTTAVADSEGRFALPYDQEDRRAFLSAWACADGHAPSRHPNSTIAFLLDQKDDLRIEIPSAGATVFQLLDVSRNPGADARLSVVQTRVPKSVGWALPTNWRHRYTASSDSEGRLRIDGIVPESVCYLRIESKDGGRLIMDGNHFLNDKPAATEPHFTLCIPPTAKVSGRVAGPRDARLPEQVRLTTELWPGSRNDLPDWPVWAGVWGVADVTPSDDGAFSAPQLAIGLLRVEADLPEDQPWRAVVPAPERIAPGDEADIQLQVVRGVKVRGRVIKKDTGEPYPGFRLAVIQEPTNEEARGTVTGIEVETDKQGWYETVVRPGWVKLRLHSAPSDYRDVESWRPREESLNMPREIPAGASEFEMPPVELVPAKQIRGKLFDRNGRPLSGWVVEGYPGPGDSVMNSFAGVHTRKDGTFEGAVPETLIPKVWKAQFRDWSDVYDFDDQDYVAEIAGQDPLVLRIDVDGRPVADAGDAPPTAPVADQNAAPLRCRLVAVPPDANDEAPDLNQTTAEFLSGDEITFAVELTNTGDQPVTLLGTRYGGSFGKSSGKLNTKGYGPRLFEFEFTDEAGNPLPRAERAFVHDTLYLSGASTHVVDPGASHTVLLRPAEFTPPMAHRLPSGKFRARVRYRGASAGALALAREFRARRPIADAWSGDVASNSVEFSVADPATRIDPESLTWGLVENGLQAAVELQSPVGDPTRAPGVPVGTPLGVIFHVKNVSDRTIDLVSEAWRQGDRAKVRNRLGAEVEVSGAWHTGMPRHVRWRLKPGEVAELTASGSSLDSLDFPGRTKVSYTVRFGGSQLKDRDGKVLLPLPDDWQGTLETGKVMLFRSASAPEAKGPDAKAVDVEAEAELPATTAREQAEQEKGPDKAQEKSQQQPEPIQAKVRLLDDTFSASGRVVDEAGQPLAGIKVRVATGIGTLLGGARATTDHEGRYPMNFGRGMTLMEDYAPLGVGVQAAKFIIMTPPWEIVGDERDYDLLMTDQTPQELAKWIERGQLWGRKDLAGMIYPNQPREVNFVLAKEPRAPSSTKAAPRTGVPKPSPDTQDQGAQEGAERAAMPE